MVSQPAEEELIQMQCTSEYTISLGHMYSDPPRKHDTPHQLQISWEQLFPNRPIVRYYRLTTSAVHGAEFSHHNKQNKTSQQWTMAANESRKIFMKAEDWTVEIIVINDTK